MAAEAAEREAARAAKVAARQGGGDVPAEATAGKRAKKKRTAASDATDVAVDDTGGEDGRWPSSTMRLARSSGGGSDA